MATGENSPKDQEQAAVLASSETPDFKATKSELELDREPQQQGPAMMAGLSSENIGVMAGKQNIGDPTAPINNPNLREGPDAQTLADNEAGATNSFSGTSMAEQLAQYNLATSAGEAALGTYAGTAAGAQAERMTLAQSEEQRRKDAALLDSLDNSLRDLGKLFADYSQEADKFVNETQDICYQMTNIQEDLFKELSDLEDQNREEQQKLEDLQKELDQARLEGDQAKIDSLSNQIEAQKTKADFSEQNWKTHKALYEEVGNKINQNNEAIAGIRRQQEELKAQMEKGEITPEEYKAKIEEGKKRIQEKMQNSLDSLKEAKQAANVSQNLQETAVQVETGNISTSELAAITERMKKITSDGKITAEELKELNEATEKSPELRKAAYEIAAQSGASVSVGDNTLSGESASNYFTDISKLTDIDNEAIRIKQQLLSETDPEKIAQLEQKLEESYAQRFEIEDRYQQSIMPQGTLEIVTDESRALDAAQSALSGATTDSIKIQGDALITKNENGEYVINYVVSGEVQTTLVKDEENAAELLSQIDAQIAEGKELASPEAIQMQKEYAAADKANYAKNLEIDSKYSYSNYQLARLQSDKTNKDQDNNAAKALALDTPDYNLDTAEEKLREAEAAVAEAAQNGGVMSYDQYMELKQQLGNTGTSVTRLDEMMEQNGVTRADEPLVPDSGNLAHNTASLAANTYVMTAFPVLGIMSFQVPAISNPKVEPINGPAASYGSFADSPEFAATNDPGIEASYNQPAQYADNVIQSPFAKALSDQPDAGTGAPSPADLQRLEQERLAREEMLRQMLTNATPTPGGQGTGTTGQTA